MKKSHRCQGGWASSRTESVQGVPSTYSGLGACRLACASSARLWSLRPLAGASMVGLGGLPGQSHGTLPELRVRPKQHFMLAEGEKGGSRGMALLASFCLAYAVADPTGLWIV